MEADRPQVLMIVDRGLPRLYYYLTDTFSAIPGIQVILDRRREARPRLQEPEGRRTERRRRPGVEQDLNSPGFAIIRPHQECR